MYVFHIKNFLQPSIFELGDYKGYGEEQYENDVYKIQHDGVNVKYYQNNTLLRTQQYVGYLQLVLTFYSGNSNSIIYNLDFGSMGVIPDEQILAIPLSPTFEPITSTLITSSILENGTYIIYNRDNSSVLFYMQDLIKLDPAVIDYYNVFWEINKYQTSGKYQLKQKWRSMTPIFKF